MLAGKCHGGGGGFFGGERVHHDPAGFALDQRDVGQVEPAQLVNAVHHLEQADLVVQQRLAPQAGVDGGRCSAFHEGIAVKVPNDCACSIFDLPGGRRNEAPFGVCKAVGV
jgi:hypothetical protein